MFANVKRIINNALAKTKGSTLFSSEEPSPFSDYVESERFESTVPSAHAKQVNSGLFAPGTRIPYDAQLVPQLKDDHRKLVALYGQFVQSGHMLENAKMHSLLTQFKELFNAHLLLEYTKLYIYMDYTFRDNKENHDLILEFRKEMNQIGKAVRAFVAKWMERGVSMDTLAEFKKETEEVGKVLVHRISTEEERLYAIYEMAPNVVMAKREMERR